nr:hypothetical protein [Derxia lacustris]
MRISSARAWRRSGWRARRVLHRARHGQRLLNLGRRGARGLVDGAHLGQHILAAAHAHAGHQHDEGDGRIAARHHRRDQSALAVADQADARAVDLGPRAQPGHAGFHVERQIGGGGLAQTGLGAAHAPVVDPQHRDAKPAQVIGQHQEGLVAVIALVAVLRPRARDEQHRRMRPRALRHGERAGQLQMRARIDEHHILAAIRERRLGRLRPARRRRLAVRHAGARQFLRRCGTAQ